MLSQRERGVDCLYELPDADLCSIGASIYFYRHIFHNWPDSACHDILTNTIPALRPNHSRVVIIDQVILNTNASTFSALIDLSMMTFGGMERTARQWRELLEGVGLTVLRIEDLKQGNLTRDWIIEAVIKD